MTHLRRLVEVAAATDVPVLIQGETGTGKTMVARMIHSAGPRADRAFVAINCAGMPEALFESEMFGHEKGAFTGAISSKEGLVEATGRGTLFLDEVGELPPSQQAKLLTVVEDREVRRVGDHRTRPVHFRLIAATGQDLFGGSTGPVFRRDLLHRLTVLRILIPPLRDRPDDLDRLARRFIKRLARRYQRAGLRLTEEAWTLLRDHPWPGNVRELEHILEGAVILTRGAVIDVEQVRAVALPAESVPTPGGGAARSA
jgi:two-component system response regulator HydG